VQIGLYFCIKTLMMTLSQSVHVSLAYRYWNSRWSHAENLRYYGSLASIEGLGGNWRVEVGLRGDDESLLPPQLARLKAMVDHRCLFTDLEAFAERPATLENVAAYLAEQLFSAPGDWSHLTIYESDSCACSVQSHKSGLQMQLKVMNLTLTISGAADESGLMTSRDQVTQAVREIHREFGSVEGLTQKSWAESLLKSLQGRIKSLNLLRVDLGDRKYILVPSE